MIEVAFGSEYRRSAKESFVLVFSGILAIAVIPLAVIRLRDERWTLAFGDAGLILIMLLLLLLLFIYVSRSTRPASILVALGFISAALVSTLLLGASEVFWAFPALMVAYFMLDARQANMLSAAFVVCFLAIAWDELSTIALAKIFLTLVTTVLLANAFALTNRRQMDTLRQMATLDPLTGVGNRRAQNRKMDSVSAVALRHNSPASVLILDIDHFKRINDTHGHMVGDRVLIGISSLVQHATRSTESLYRYGGEEFVVVAEQTSLDAAVHLAEKLRSLIERASFTAGILVTVSIGVAELQQGESSEEWLGRADAALYRAKENGRNQVMVAGAPATTRIVRMSSHPRTLPNAQFNNRNAYSGVQ
jgi:diguanylate cyclase (GGDEF)-like protein